MSGKRKPKATAKQALSILPLSRGELDKFVRIAHENLIAAMGNAKKLADCKDEDAAASHPTKAESAKAFLWMASRLMATIDLVDKEAAVKAALLLGSAAASFFPNRNGKTMLEVEQAYEGHGKGGEGTKRIKGEDDVINLLSTYKKYEGKYGEYSKTAKDLFDQGITGQGGKKPMSARTVRRHIDALKESSDRPDDVDNGSVG